MSAALPSPSLLIDNNNNKSLSSIVVLKEKLHQLDSLLFNRETLLKELRDMISKVSFNTSFTLDRNRS
jgi:hypothetical protein